MGLKLKRTRKIALGFSHSKRRAHLSPIEETVGVHSGGYRPMTSPRHQLGFASPHASTLAASWCRSPSGSLRLVTRSSRCASTRVPAGPPVDDRPSVLLAKRREKRPIGRGGRESSQAHTERTRARTQKGSGAAAERRASDLARGLAWLWMRGAKKARFALPQRSRPNPRHTARGADLAGETSDRRGCASTCVVCTRLVVGWSSPPPSAKSARSSRLPRPSRGQRAVSRLPSG